MLMSSVLMCIVCPIVPSLMLVCNAATTSAAGDPTASGLLQLDECIVDVVVVVV